MISRRSFNVGLSAAWLLSGRHAFADPAKPKDLGLLVEEIPYHRALMRDIVVQLAAYAKARKPGFPLLVRDAPGLLIKEKREWELQFARDPDGDKAGRYTPIGSIDESYLSAVDGIVFDGLFYGGNTFDQPTGADDAKAMQAVAAMMTQQDRRVFAIEYCKSAKARDDAVKQAAARKAICFIDDAPDKTLARIPSAPPSTENPRHIATLGEVSNFLPLLDPNAFPSHQAWVSALGATNYDLLVMDAFWRGDSPVTAREVTALKFKHLGTQRQVFAVLPVGHATTGSYYWNGDWKEGNPAWLQVEDPGADGRFIVQYWDPAWKAILGKSIQGLMDLGFDGILLDAVDAYLYFEEITPLQ
jgi:endo-alpha-1,4-polygalactosaminidase (GH114 family)